MSGERTYGGASAQQRHDERRERLIRAVFDLLATDGTVGLTIRKVAATAGVSPRYVYEDFTDLDDLRCSTFDSAAEEIAGLVLDAVADLPP
ncbi:MAG TPA: TetR/AcrR family transcriptional regulator, partial [Pseudonocardiaceae bacterium]